jgi:phage tail P2-like protein
MNSLLPPNATPQETAIEAATARIAEVPVPNAALWNPATCPAALLPWLAWALSVDDWDGTWPEERQRAVISASVAVHRRKGTRGAVVAALAAAGYGTATLVERFGRDFYNGAAVRNGSIDRAPADHWAEYRVVLTRPITNEQADRVRAILASVAPLRCRLKLLTYQAVAHTHNGAIQRDGTFNYGAA